MNFSYNWLQSFFEKKLPYPEKLAEVLTMHFAEVEEIKKMAGDFVLNIDIRPNRAGDCLSHIGIAEEISAILGLKLKNQKLKITENKKIKNKDFVSIEVKDKKSCFRYTAKIITNLKINASPKWLKQRIQACGLKPINNIVDIANYVMLETGQPLHAFDADKIEGKKIIIRKAKKQEKITTLDKENHNLSEDVLVIADEKTCLAVAGIKGGKKAEIDEKTKTIVLEAANFDSKTIRKASKQLNLKTDACLRFEHGVDINLTEKAIFQASCLIQEIAKGKPVSGLIDFYPKKIFPRKIKFDFNYVEKLLGIKIPEKEIKRILKSLGFKISGIFVEIPSKRQDVSISEDLIEEIGRIYGYEKIPAVFPTSALIPMQKNKKVFWEEMAKNILKEAGFIETYNYSFFSEQEVKFFNLPKKELIELKNPLSQDYKYLRTSLIPGLLKNVEKNSKLFPEIMIFEIGKRFKSSEKEKTVLAGAINSLDFLLLKGKIEFLLKKMGINKACFNEYQTNFCEPGKSAEINVNNQFIGFLGQSNKTKTVLFEIDFEKLLEFVSEVREYKSISKYPSATRDIAIFVPETVKAGQVLNRINFNQNKLIKKVDLFDVYQGKEIPKNRKSLAFRITYQAEDKTLSSNEIDELQNKIIRFLEKNPEWKVRK